MTYNILEFGAKVSDSLQTDAIQAAIDACFQNGGGEVVIPAGIFRTGGLLLRSHVTLHLLSGAMLEGSEDWRDYDALERNALEAETLQQTDDEIKGAANMHSQWQHALIRAVRATDVAIIGEPYSWIDGRNCFDPGGEENYRGPHGINMWDCENITLRGYTIRNTGNWAHALFRCRNIDIENIVVYGGHDGVDIFLSQNARIANCHIYTGDDCVAGFGNEDVTVRDCVLHSGCSVIRIAARNMLVERCTSAAPEFAFRGTMSAERKAKGALTVESDRHRTITAFLYYCDGRFGDLSFPQPGNIVIRDCVFGECEELFNMDFGRHQWCCHRPLESIIFENCTLTGAVLPIYIHGGEEIPVTFTMKNVEISPAAGHETDCVMDAENFMALNFENVHLKGYCHPRIIIRSEGTVKSRTTTPFAIEKGEPGMSEVHGH